jgi:hypothetical protein
VPRIKYQEMNFGAARLTKIAQANLIIAEYQAQGYLLTLRQLYYQFVGRDLIANNMREYKNLGTVINDARLAGLIDWSAIEDRTREYESNSHWDSPEAIVSAVAEQFRYDTWEDQPYRIEVWIEKEALAGVFERVCRELDIGWFPCRGYTSQSEMWSAAQRLLGYRAQKQKPVILHFGDHDPSGIDMTRDIVDRLALFMGGRSRFELLRLALNMEQVEEYGPPPNPAKVTDSRFESYQAVHGEESWELDALEPRVLAGLVRKTVLAYRDEALYAAALDRQKKARALLSAVSDNWNHVAEDMEFQGFVENYDEEEEPDGGRRRRGPRRGGGRGAHWC